MICRQEHYLQSSKNRSLQKQALVASTDVLLMCLYCGHAHVVHVVGKPIFPSPQTRHSSDKTVNHVGQYVPKNMIGNKQITTTIRTKLT